MHCFFTPCKWIINWWFLYFDIWWCWNLDTSGSRSKTLGKFWNLTFMGPCIANVFSSTTNKMQRYTLYLFLWNALHASGGFSTNHQELKTVYTASGILSKLYCYLPLSWKRWNSEMWSWRRIEQVSWLDRVINVETLHRIKEERNILCAIKGWKANCIGYILQSNCLLLKALLKGI